MSDSFGEKMLFLPIYIWVKTVFARDVVCGCQMFAKFIAEKVQSIIKNSKFAVTHFRTLTFIT